MSESVFNSFPTPEGAPPTAGTVTPPLTAETSWADGSSPDLPGMSGLDMSSVGVGQNGPTLSDHDLLGLTLNRLNNGLIITDAQGTVQRMNQVACQLTGWSAEVARGRHFNEILTINEPQHDTELFCPVRRTLRGESKTGAWRHCVMTTVDGHPLNIDVSTSPLYENGAFSGVLAVFRDVSEREAERKLGRIRLQHSEERYHSLIAAIAQMTWTTPPDGSVIDIPLWREYTGQTREEVRGFGWLEAVHPDEREQTREAWLRAVKERRTYRNENRVRRCDGEYRTFAVRAIPILEKDGTIREWVGAHTDIHERKQAEALIAGQTRVLEMIARGAPLVETLQALALLIEEHSGALCSIAVLREDKQWLDLVANPSLPEEFTSRYPVCPVGEGKYSCGSAAYSGQMVVVEDIYSDPKWADAVELPMKYGLRACWSVPVLWSGEVVGTFAMYYREPRQPREQELRLLEIANNLAGIAIVRQKTEANLQTALDRECKTSAELTSILTRIADGVMMANVDGIITYENAIAQQLHSGSTLGMDLKQPVHPAVDLRYPDGTQLTNEQLPLYRAVFHGEEVADEEISMHMPGGKIYTIQANAVPVRDDNGRQLGAVLTLRDITPQRRMMQDLLDANQSKDQFLAILSHELRTPLTPILGWASLLRQMGQSDPDMFKQAVDAIQRNAELQKRLVNDLLDTTRIVSHKLRIEKRMVSLNDLAQLAVHSVKDQAADQEVTIEHSLGENVPSLHMDPERIQQVLMNLLSNAAKFSPRGSTVRIETRVLEVPTNSLEPGEEPPAAIQQAIVEVIDEGQGIAPELLPHVFDLFRQGDSSFTRRHGGLGLGLAISKSLVEMHGGTISAHSEGLGHGARFRVILPVTTPSETSDEENSPVLN